ncbi:thrombospondin type 3 repeat-containing protein, partial [Myxococcota bacterium]|nr:thrombospondin type 3 repeat-containing protein [Myxococcota bacterium]
MRATTVGPITELAASGATVEQRSPSIAWDGAQYVVVWQDARNAATTGLDLFVARIDPAGVLVDPLGIPVLTPAVAGDQSQPQITFNPLNGMHVIVWVDPRNTSADLYATRFFPSTGSILEQGGIQVSSESEPDDQPSVACALQSCVFLWRSTVGASTEIRGRRFFPDGTPLDGTPFPLLSGGTGAGASQGRPRVAAVATDFIVTFEDDRNVATSGLDVFLRTMPDFGTIPGASGSAITTATLRQTEADVAILGGGLGIVWQDQRTGALTDDIWGRAYTNAGAPRGNELLVGGAIEDQLRPRIAGDASRGLVVWQDRRNGALGFTYGTRLDAAGAVVDARGFPLLPATANVFEHAVAKGPNADYLVAAVRFGATPRIVYRIVRDEPPAGTMMASGALQVPADGTTAADLDFGPARGASMLPVVDGTLYTVTLSRTDVSVSPADLDPSTPGLQIGAVDGRVRFALTSLEHGSVDVQVASLEGTSAGSATVLFDNVPPVATDVVVGPPAPRSTEDLVLTYTYSDVNSDPEAGTTIEWTKNLAIQSGLNNQRTVPASATSRGDQWRARVTPRDGLNPGTFVFSNTVTIGNTPPVVLGARIDPATNVRTGTGISARYTFDDPDGDAQAPATVVRWFLNGGEVAALEDETAVPGTMVVKGQSWSFSVEPNDGFEFGATVTSAPITVENTAPVADAGANGAVIERRSYTLSAAGSSDVDPQDVLRYRWTQASGAVTVTLSDTSSRTPSFSAPSVTGTTILQFELVVNDGDADSAPDRVVVEISPVRDTDADGLDDEEEVVAGTDPNAGDTDRDGLGDAEEVAATTNPVDEDTDDDGVRDGAEGRSCPDCAPAPLADTDGDELIHALDWDGDGDGLADGTELGVRAALTGTNPAANHFVADADPTTTTDPTLADTDGDSVLDGVEDANHDGKVDVGESDPNNPADPPIACTPGVTQCPNGTVCEGGTCRIPSNVDGGLTCRPLSAQNIECCTGGCRDGTLAEPVCTMQGALEQCPIGAQQCTAGSCSAEPPPPTGGDSGCACT